MTEESASPAHARKRAAFESPTRLARPLALDPTMARPAATVAGATLVLLRVLSGVLWLFALTYDWGRASATLVIDEAGLTADESTAVLVAIWIGMGLVLLVEAVLAVLILRGKNLPRVIVMFLSVASISTVFFAWWVQGQDIRIDTTLVTLALDILVLLALSSRSAAAYARRNERR
ncbi:hypothetical protein AB0N73_14125 [Microbacterium sp. NPDC089189]|uniref:hypothetical protein n=1 Tax=Microbacterium sp. NPDC089189 TaxID=3154972 RepID=UPI00343EDF61